MAKRRILVASTAVVLALGIALGLMEAVFRFLPVQTPLRAMAVNAENPVARLVPGQTFTWSNDGLFSIVADGRINNFGFVNDQGYVPEAQTPLVAVIGDSFVEALMVKHPDTFQGRLQKKIGKKGRVYSFARSGAALSQYLAYAGWVQKNFQPAGMIFVVSGNDFDESVAPYGSLPGMHVFNRNPDGGYGLKRIPYAPNWKGLALLWLAERSRLASYLLLNLKVESGYHALKKRLKNFDFSKIFSPSVDATARPQYVGNVRVVQTSARMVAAERAIALFFRDLPGMSGLPANKVMFVVDGLKVDPGSPEAFESFQKTYFARIRQRFMLAAKSRGYEVIDMQPDFLKRHRLTGVRFNFRTDGHWNAAAHGLAAKLAGKSRLFDSVFVSPAAVAPRRGSP